jgi:hypothetical protein
MCDFLATDVLPAVFLTKQRRERGHMDSLKSCCPIGMFPLIGVPILSVDPAEAQTDDRADAQQDLRMEATASW